MKELKGNDDKPILKAYYPFSRKRTQKKRWMIALSRSHYDQRTHHNEALESTYHKVVGIVKSVMTGNEIFFERDYKYDLEDGIFGIYTFFTQHFYWMLDCSLDYQYQITVAIHQDCPYANVVRPLLNAYPLNMAMEITLSKAEFNTRFANTILAQDPRYHLTLKGDHS